MFKLLAILGLTYILSLSSISRAGDKTSNAYSMSAIGPRLIDVPETLHAKIRADKSIAYQQATKFGEDQGHYFVDMVVSRLDLNKKTTIIVAMGGAEHLGTLVEMALKGRGLLNKIDLRYIDLSRKVVKPWIVQAENAKWWRKPKLVGIGPIPDGYALGGIDLNESDIAETTKLLEREGVFQNRRILVIDTGFNASIPEAVGDVVRTNKFNNEVEGLMLALDLNIQMQHRIPIYSAMLHSKYPDMHSSSWARELDLNQTLMTDVDKRGLPVFPRSSNSMSSETVRSYQETLLGMSDGLALANMAYCGAALSEHAFLLQEFDGGMKSANR